MKRREFVGRVGLGSAALISAGGAVGAATKREDEEHGHRALSGPLASATVSFGAWPATFDRMTQPPPPPPPPNLHQLVPNVVTIKEGGTVNYIIAGLHQVAIYSDVKPEDIDLTNLVPIGAGLPPAINDPNNRVFRGISPAGVPFDRVEVVHFPNRGRFLVICAILPHFNDGMFGWVRVIK